MRRIVGFVFLPAGGRLLGDDRKVEKSKNYYKKQRYMLQNDTPWGRSDIRQKISRSLESGNRLDFWPGKLISKELLTPVTFVVFSAP